MTVDVVRFALGRIIPIITIQSPMVYHWYNRRGRNGRTAKVAAAVVQTRNRESSIKPLLGTPWRHPTADRDRTRHLDLHITAGDARDVYVP